MAPDSRQSGISLLGFIICLFAVSAFGYMLIQLTPAYIEYTDIVHTMEESEYSFSQGQGIEQIRKHLLYRFGMLYIKDDIVRPENITITSDRKGRHLRVSYDRKIPFIYNIDFLIHFEESVLLKDRVVG